MRSSKHLAFSLIAAVVVLAAGLGLLVWPTLTQASQVAADIEDLDHKNRTLEERTEVVKELSKELDAARATAAYAMKRIPARPDLHEMLHQLSMPVDGYMVADQKIDSGTTKPAASDESITAWAVPITVTLVARFEAVQEMLRRAESMDRLVRVASVSVRRHPEKANLATDDDALLQASIMLEAIFDPGANGSAKP